MINKIKNFLFCCFAIILICSCYEDKGSYDHLDYNRVETLRWNDTGGETVLGDTLRLKINITWKYPDRDTTDSAFEYCWEIEDEIVSTERVLTFVPTLCGNFDIRFFITEKATGIVSFTYSTFTVTSPYRRGWVLLSEKEEKTMLSYVRYEKGTDGKPRWTDFADIYAKAFPENPLPENITYMEVYYVGETEDEILLFYEDGEDQILSGEDFSMVMPLRNDFAGNKYPSGFNLAGYVRGGYYDYILGKDGSLYSRENLNANSSRHEIPFGDFPVVFPKGARIDRVFPRNMNNGSGYVLFLDGLNNRFVACYASDGTGSPQIVLDIINPYAPAQFADITNLSGYEVVYSGDHSDGVYRVNLLKEKSSGLLWLQNFKLNQQTDRLTVTDASQKVFPGSSLVSDRSVYCRMRISSYLFFAEGSRLYFYDMNTERVKLYSDFGSGTITHLEQNPINGYLGVTLDTGDFHICEALSNEVLGADDPGAIGIVHTLKGLGKIKVLAWKRGGLRGSD